MLLLIEGEFRCISGSPCRFWIHGIIATNTGAASKSCGSERAYYRLGGRTGVHPRRLHDDDYAVEKSPLDSNPRRPCQAGQVTAQKLAVSPGFEAGCGPDIWQFDESALDPDSCGQNQDGQDSGAKMEGPLKSGSSGMTLGKAGENNPHHEKIELRVLTVTPCSPRVG